MRREDDHEKEKEIVEVKHVLRRLQHLGLEIRPGGNHWKIFHPATGVWLFDVSKTPSDPNWHYNIQRNLKRMGMSLQAEVKKRRGSHRKHTAVDLVALKKAQDEAAAAGVRIPLLSDLDEAPPTSPLWQRDSKGSFVLAAEQEVIDNMTIRAEAARMNYLRGRLQNFFAEKGDELRAVARARHPMTRPGLGEKSEFVRIAMDEVAPQRGLKSFKNFDAGQACLSRFLNNDKAGISVWAANLIEATMDHIGGMKWGVDEALAAINGAKVEKAEEEVTGPSPIPEEPDILPEAAKPEEVEVPEITAEDIGQMYKEIADREMHERGYVPAVNGLKERYANILLKILEEGGHRDQHEFDTIVERLDRLILGAAGGMKE